MTERKSGPPHDLINGTEHFWLWDWKPVACEVVDGGWKVPGFQTPRSTAEMQAEGWWYVGPSPTSEEAAASVADARRFRLIASLDHGGTREIRLSGVKRNGDVWGHGISWDRTSDHADIRAAIDAEMKEQGDG